ncbi:MAG: hypothetical protein QXG80_00830 [Nanopusillaceae archaeon]
MKMYKMHQAKFWLSEKAVRSLMINDLDNFSSYVIISVEFSSEELKMFANNFVVYYDNNEIYVVPIGYEVIDDNLDKISNVREYKSSYKRIVNELINYRNKVADIKSMESINKDELRELKDVFDIGDSYLGFRIRFGFNVLKDELEKFVNKYAIENGRLPNEKEIKEFIISYMKSFDLKNVFDYYINKLNKFLQNEI